MENKNKTANEQTNKNQESRWVALSVIACLFVLTIIRACAAARMDVRLDDLLALVSAIWAGRSLYQGVHEKNKTQLIMGIIWTVLAVIWLVMYLIATMGWAK